MGRIVCDVARKRVRKCVGVELYEPLCEIAQRNSTRLRGKKSPIEIVCDDAARADLSQGTIYFMFNPFGAETMRDVIANIHESLSENPRAITICYYNAMYEPILAHGGWLEMYYNFTTAGGLRVSFWRNRRADEGRLSA
jgi:H2-forming N5,N10-methylenetetrahydromethanopterin dehydrogenase-like enzyme